MSLIDNIDNSAHKVHDHKSEQETIQELTDLGIIRTIKKKINNNWRSFS